MQKILKNSSPSSLQFRFHYSHVFFYSPFLSPSACYSLDKVDPAIIQWMGFKRSPTNDVTNQTKQEDQTVKTETEIMTWLLHYIVRGSQKFTGTMNAPNLICQPHGGERGKVRISKVIIPLSTYLELCYSNFWNKKKVGMQNYTMAVYYYSKRWCSWEKQRN